jgi:hypothetical protein
VVLLESDVVLLEEALDALRNLSTMCFEREVSCIEHVCLDVPEIAAVWGRLPRPERCGRSSPTQSGSEADTSGRIPGKPDREEHLSGSRRAGPVGSRRCQGDQSNAKHIRAGRKSVRE